MAADSTTHSGPPRGRRRASGSGGGGVHVTLFFTFVLAYFAIYTLMFCTLATTLGGIFLLILALLLLVPTYLAGA